VRIRSALATFLGIAAAITAYLAVLLPRLRRWGATPDELARRMPGDDLVTRPRWTMTMAVSVRSRPEATWPWLAQIGYQRGGLYSYDWLDRLFGILDRPSADRILPEFQHLQTGDVIPLGAGPGWPVAAVEPGRSLVLAPEAPGVRVSWVFELLPVDTDSTRLVTRVRADFDLTPALALQLALIDPTAFLMTRRMLLGIRQRAERAPMGADRVVGERAARPVAVAQDVGVPASTS
jgi:hypothetical protein